MANKYTTTGGSTLDVTDTTINKDSKEPTTPREGGFTLRNRINFSSASIVANGANVLAAGKLCNIFKLLEVPARTSLRSVRICKVPGKTNFAAAQSSAAASNSGATLGVGTIAYKNASLSAITDPDALADHAIVKSTGAMPAAFFSGSASTPNAWDVSQSDGSAPVLPLAFPYGGFVTMNIVDGSGGSSASSDGIKMTGTFEIVADADYMPV